MFPETRCAVRTAPTVGVRALAPCLNFAHLALPAHALRTLELTLRLPPVLLKTFSRPAAPWRRRILLAALVMHLQSTRLARPALTLGTALAALPLPRRLLETRQPERTVAALVWTAAAVASLPSALLAVPAFPNRAFEAAFRVVGAVLHAPPALTAPARWVGALSPEMERTLCTRPVRLLVRRTLRQTCSVGGVGVDTLQPMMAATGIRVGAFSSLCDGTLAVPRRILAPRTVREALGVLLVLLEAAQPQRRVAAGGTSR
mmetsp:Transcript_48249/g.113900  ORF Transcript_48249/g.113900 Transcript_48249/m.113900 type:complete len:260 (-) Transcript_48249:989-1768(-)